jgi:IS30 family transposase
MAHKQLTRDERYQIAALHHLRFGPTAIARQLGRHVSTISRELARNRTVKTQYGHRVVLYDGRMAGLAARRRRQAKGVAQRKIQGELRTVVEHRLRLGWSPEQVSGRLLVELGIRLSFETIYQHVLRDAHEHRGTLRFALRFGGYKQHRFRRSRHADRTRRDKHHIENRPAAANERTELGHWERDCVLGARDCDAALLTLVDRKSRYACIVVVGRLASSEVARATVAALAPHHTVTKSVTNDNGQEFQRAGRLETELGVPIYFCAPSSPWQRGSVENLNGLVRQYVPKGADIDALAAWVPGAIEDALNHRPRKRLGFRTPHEVFFDQRMELMHGPLLRLGLEFSGPN